MSVDPQSKTKKKEALPALDRTMRSELPASIALRSPPHISQPELAAAVRWKMMRGKFRPRLQQYADAADGDEVVDASSAAFAAAQLVTQRLLTDGKQAQRARGAVLGALSPLTAIKGVGPATASGLLVAANPWLPYMVDEAVELVGERKYTAEVYADFCLAMARRAAALGARGGEEAGTWTPRDVADAIWAAAHCPGGAGGGAAAKAGRAAKRPAGRAAAAEASDGKASASKRGRRAGGFA